MARVVLEGMASGLPVIITPLCGYEGIVEDGVEGFLVPPRDPQAIAERLRRLSADGELRVRMGRAARARAEEHAWPRFEARFLDVLRRGWLT
jgi:glycosyltransferase involved in cell wall biosynthesis